MNVLHRSHFLLFQYMMQNYAIESCVLSEVLLSHKIFRTLHECILPSYTFTRSSYLHHWIGRDKSKEKGKRGHQWHRIRSKFYKILSVCQTMLGGKAHGYYISSMLPCYRPWRPIRLREVKAPTLVRQTANRWRQGCQPYAPAALCPQVSFIFKDSWYSASLSQPQGHNVRPEGLGRFKKIHLIGTWTCDLLACALTHYATACPCLYGCN
jgi:hypothetical protein